MRVNKQWFDHLLTAMDQKVWTWTRTVQKLDKFEIFSNILIRILLQRKSFCNPSERWVDGRALKLWKSMIVTPVSVTKTFSIPWIFLTFGEDWTKKYVTEMKPETTTVRGLRIKVGELPILP